MNTEIFYSEKQKFSQRWIKALLYFLLIFTFFISILIYTKQEKTIVAFIPFFIVALLTILFKKMELKLAINDENIGYQFIPFHSKMRIISKKDILHISLDNYNPISDYGGWGIRFGRKGRAYTTDGNFGIQLKITGKKNILIGTMKPKEVYSILKEKGYIPAVIFLIIKLVKLLAKSPLKQIVLFNGESSIFLFSNFSFPLRFLPSQLCTK